jgi:Leucine-rich repeat (LRR) protein
LNKLYLLPNLKELYCDYNILTSLECPTTLEKLDCSNNQLSSIDNLQLNLKELYCGYNEITNLNNLPSSLNKLHCGNNKITNLDNLSSNITELYCRYNPLNYNFELTLENIRKYNLENHK